MPLEIQYGNISLPTRTAVTTNSVNSAQVSNAEVVFGNGSALFNSVNSAITIINNGALNLGTGNFTIECRYRAITKPTAFPQIIFGSYANSMGANNWAISDRETASNKFLFVAPNFGGNNIPLTSTTTPVNNTWYALAVTRSGNTLRMFVDGILEASQNFTGSIDGNVTGNRAIGTSGAGVNAYINAYVDEVRFSNIARYTANYTVATSPFTNDDNTTLLLHCDGANGSTSFPDDNLGLVPAGGITVDYANVTTVTRTAQVTSANANAITSNAQFVFGNASMRTTATGDWVKVDNSASLNFGTNPFTFEFRYNSVANTASFPSVFNNFNISDYGFVSNSWTVQERRTGTNTLTFWVVNFNNGVPLLTSNVTVGSNTWYSVAIQRHANNVFQMYLNGNLASSASYAGTLDGSNNRSIFCSQNASTVFYNGYLDEIRISNTARYTTNYTPATQAFTNDANTVLLLHCDGANAANSFPDDNTNTVQGGVTITY